MSGIVQASLSGPPESFQISPKHQVIPSKINPPPPAINTDRSFNSYIPRFIFYFLILSAIHRVRIIVISKK